MLLGVFAFQAFAQEATIVGTVTDPAGSAIPNATITITATGTDQVRRLTSNDTGQFVAPDLHIGQYVVRVEAAGFKSVERSGVVLAVGDRSRMDVQMQIGDTKDSINV
ncbi:MAG TPA: carboxypeptidase-like regulatory domain-containing protein, partial [Candidatus Solibacter sp.]|nr:carboxypeptidase-like regulatory domain-containing protein [Candidatus Solibacter sp.]